MMVSLLIITTLILLKTWPLTIVTISLLVPYFASKMYFNMSIPHFFSIYLYNDPMSTLLILLSLWTTALMIINSFKIYYQKANHKQFISITLMLLIILIIAFSVTDLMSFYIYFEASLIPTLMIILMWGYQPERLQAGSYLMMYTVSASLPLFMSMMVILKNNYSLSWILSPSISFYTSAFSFFMTLAFMVKIPIYPFHLWLPKAHVEAPVAGSMILASVLLKLGVYGLMLTMSLLNLIIFNTSFLYSSLALVGALITSTICLRTTDLKMLIAYASIGHMGIMINALLYTSITGWTGSMIMMIAHGLASSGLFAATNAHYETFNTRNLLMAKGLLLITPSMAFMWFMLISANMGAPPSLNLMAEFLILSSMWFSSSINMLFIIMIPLLSVAYSLILFTSMFHGAPHEMAPKMYNQKSVYLLSATCHLIPIFFLTSSPYLFSL